MTKLNTIYDILKKQGPKSSSEIKKILIKKYTLSADAASQRISRAGKPINKIKGWLPSNEVYLYLDEHVKNQSFYKRFYEELIRKNSSYGIVLASIVSRGGVISESEFYCVTGSPYKLKKQISGSKLKNGLLKKGFLVAQNSTLMGPTLIINPVIFTVEKEALIKARLITEKIFIGLLKEWLEKNCFTAYKIVKYRGIDVESARKVGQFAWDIEGPSYLRTMVRKAETKKVPETFRKNPGFIVCDVLLRDSVNKNALLAFMKKVEVCERTAKTGAIFPIFIASHFEKDAFNFAKSKGVLISTPENLFGKDISKKINEIMHLLQPALENTSPELIENFIKKTFKYYETFSTLKGYAFELICSYLSNFQSSNSVYLQKVIRVDGIQKEIDIMNVEKNDASITFIEAKSKEKSNLVSAEEVKEWKEKTDTINHWLKKPENHHYRESSIMHELWTNTDLDEEAKKEFKKITSKRKKYLFKNGTDIRKMSTTNKRSKGISDTLKQYF